VAEVRHSDDQVTSLYVGGMTRAELLDALAGAGVRLNEHAQTLLEGPAFEPRSADALEVAVRSVGELGLADGSVFADILDAAGGHGLAPCPPDTGPYLRLMVDDQASAPDRIMSTGRAPTGSITVATERLRPEESYPRGFYLRVLAGEPWLRGYRCSDDHPWSADDRFAFRRT
jgi:hypothetical protein